ncbi:uncharacterized protein RHIMIDRAFT_280102 [Rhizopus microsporus ATCC 52813]|uniref:RGS domain-containing protein n=2 Tax=Rhizopus microsporus TaxID=58291 RepID=A0A2G4SY31_RHIZD|nr:uncharacterized protein RHIMIDRAFT_280102 [Rhizopus microsporus ATCC 52813]PHZ13672.1 hypothetical protein RHIMIDRAFT_280102 [Rhizopus microsporus ATCC 52813]
MAPYPQPLAYTSMIKFTIDGRPSVDDIHELFSTMMAQITPTVNRHMLRSYPNTFTSEEAIKQLGSLTFSKPSSYSNFASFTTITFNMGRDMAKALLQQFLWTRLIESAIEPQNRSYRDKGLWRVKSKGLCVLQDFCSRTKSDMSIFKKHVMADAEPLFLISIERLPHNDRINRNRRYMSFLFAIMIASLPLKGNNRERQGELPSFLGSYGKLNSYTEAMREFGIQDTLEASRTPSICSSNSSSLESKHSGCGLSFSDFFPHINILPNDLLLGLEHAHGIHSQQHQSLINNLSPSSSNKFKMRAIFSSALCCNWLVESCTIASNDEAENLMTEFLKLGWITFFDNKYGHLQEIESSKSIILKLTKSGMKAVIEVSLNQYNIMKASMKAPGLSCRSSSISSSCDTSLPSSLAFTDDQETSISPVSPRLNTSVTDYFSTQSFRKSLPEISTPPLTPTTPTFEPKESTSAKLRSVLNDPHLRSLFRDFLGHNFCEENLNFWIDYDSLCRRCSNPALMSSSDQRQLLEDAYLLWETYLGPDASCELNIEHNLREEMAEEISHMVTVVHTPGKLNPTVVISAFSAYQSLLTILRWFDKVNDHVFKLMATDSIPKFIKSSQYKLYIPDNQAAPVSVELNEFPPPPSRQDTKQNSVEIPCFSL